MSLKFPSEFRLNHPNERHSTTKAIDATRIERRRPWNVVGASTRHVGFHSITIQRKLNLPVIDFVKEALDVDRDDETLAAVWSRMTENRSSLDSCSRRLVGFATGTQIPQQLALQSFEIPERGLNPTPPTRWLWLESGSIGLGRDSRANPYLFCRNPKRTGQSRQARLATPVCGSAETYWEFVATTANSTGDMNGLEDYLELGDYFGQQETHLHKPPHAPLGVESRESEPGRAAADSCVSVRHGLDASSVSSCGSFSSQFLPLRGIESQQACRIGGDSSNP